MKTIFNSFLEPDVSQKLLEHSGATNCYKLSGKTGKEKEGNVFYMSTQETGIKIFMVFFHELDFKKN